METSVLAPTTLTQSEQQLVHIFQLLGDKTRYKMFKLLVENKGLCVGEIAQILHISSSAVSQHFRSFEILGVVEKQRSGLKICYALKPHSSISMNMASIIKNNLDIKGDSNE